MKNLIKYGWNSFHENFYKNNNSDLLPSRVIVENKNNFLLAFSHGEIIGELSGKLMFSAENQSDLPKVGDWVLINYFDEYSHAIIQEVLPRKTKLSRKIAGSKTEEQIIAANIDTIFIVQSLDATFKINRVERYLVAARESKARPVIILSKSDLCSNTADIVETVKLSTKGTEIIAICSFDDASIQIVNDYIKPGETIAMIGPSGVGKSTLINKLIGKELQNTNDVRFADSKGRHTTTRRELFQLPNGGLIIDTPGMRELQLWSNKEVIGSVFSEFEDLAVNCRYDNCMHLHETGCAVIKALEEGIISEQRYNNYLKMLKEVKYLETKMDEGKKLNSKKKWKSINKEMRRFQKNHDKRHRRF
ncbi:MAG: ribosome small subunit-dependent GTPase A [Melioribacteraceae bacterium]|nr:ribosome small subunit-dependent GTPase A [Melioribacteraceae bacterium]